LPFGKGCVIILIKERLWYIETVRQSDNLKIPIVKAGWKVKNKCKNQLIIPTQYGKEE